MHHLELTDAEVKAVQAALTAYLKIKGAERMLTYHRQLKADRAAAEQSKARYDRLLTLTGDVLRRL